MLKMAGAAGSGSVPIEAILTLVGTRHEVIEAVTEEDDPRLMDFWAKRFPFVDG